MVSLFRLLPSLNLNTERWQIVQGAGLYPHEGRIQQVPPSKEETDTLHGQGSCTTISDLGNQWSKSWIIYSRNRE